MKLSNTFMVTLREVPADSVIASQTLMLRASMLRKLANGLFAYLPMGLRSFRKVENIIREEMDAIGGLEIKPSVVVPGEFWKESGRWDTMGESMLRVKNRQGSDFVISPTAEEAFTTLVRENVNSYKQLPLTLYQINTKYRDEIRPRYGVMRGREFTMKDAYSYHVNDDSLDEVYQKMAKAYRRIFKRCGLKVIPVQADTGAMGGSASEEFMVESAIGDNTLILSDCGFAANVEKAEVQLEAEVKPQGPVPAMSKVSTPGKSSIADVSALLKKDPKAFIKMLIYKAFNVELDLTGTANEPKKPKDAQTYPEAFFAVLIRGDLDINETKLAAKLKASDVVLASEAEVERITGAPLGFAGPQGFSGCALVADPSVMIMHDAISGGLEKDVHIEHVEPNRDFKPAFVFDLRVAKTGDLCLHCGKPVHESKGNELGHIFKLGYKYTKSMKVAVLDETGKPLTPTMGCYGIGVDRTLASIIEEHHDDNGIIWPMSIAPYQVYLTPIKCEGEMAQVADQLYQALTSMGVEVLFDDRSERPGVKFKDADLIGIPIRVIISDKILPNSIELKERDKKDAELIPLDGAAQNIAKRVFDALKNLNE